MKCKTRLISEKARGNNLKSPWATLAGLIRFRKKAKGIKRMNRRNQREVSTMRKRLIKSTKKYRTIKIA